METYRHLLVVHTHADPRGYIPRFKAQGFRVTLIKKTPSAKDVECFDRILAIDFQREITQLIDRVRELHRADPFDAVLSFSESGVLPVSLLAAALGLPHNAPAAVLNTRNKFLTRRALETRGLPTPPYCAVRSAKDIHDAVARLGRPMVLKPISGSSSYGVAKIRPGMSEAEIGELFRTVTEYIADYPRLNAEYPFEFWLPPSISPLLEWDEMDPGRELLLEGFLDGPQVSVDGFVSNGRVQTFGIIDVTRQPNRTWFLESEESCPSRLPGDVQQRILSCVEKTVAAVGLTRSLFHCEMRVVDGEPFVLEIAARHGADNIVDFVRHLYGVELSQIGLELALGESPAVQAEPRGAVTMRYFLPEQAGVLRAIEGADEVRAHPNVRELVFEFAPGDAIGVPPESFEFLGYLSVCGRDMGEAERLLDELYGQVRFRIEPSVMAVETARVSAGALNGS